MKRLLHTIFLMVGVSVFTSMQSCQQAHLVEEWDEESSANGGRNEKNGKNEKKDSTTVTPDFDINGWEGAIDANFTFGGEETN